MADKVVKGAFLLTPEGLKRNWGLRLSQGRIQQVGPNEELSILPGDEVTEARGQLILPGFVNGHNHMYGFLSHGITAEAMVTEFSSFLDDFWWPYVENRVDHRLAAVTARWACAEMIDSGVTAFVDIMEGPNALPGVLEAEHSVVAQSGLRGRLSFEACERISPENGQLGLAENMKFIEKYNHSGNLVQGMNSIHTLFTCSGEFIRQAKEMSAKAGAMTHMHLSESVYEPEWCHQHLGKTPTEVYEELGYLDEQVLASQIVQVSDRELDILAARKVKAVTMPLSNCEVGGGFAPVPEMLARGMQVGLGTDGYINNFFEVMRGAFLVHKAHHQNPQVMPAKTVYEMATAMGAKAIGIEDTGALVPGYLADVITVDATFPTPVNEANVYDQLVLFCNPDKVVHVLCNGEWLKKDGHLVTIQKEKARKELCQATEAFWNVKSQPM